jgi:hypothetical protein
VTARPGPYVIPPVAWTPDRDARGAARPGLPRCPHFDCPVRYRDGADRPCPGHDPASALLDTLSGADRKRVLDLLEAKREAAEDMTKARPPGSG